MKVQKSKKELTRLLLSPHDSDDHADTGAGALEVRE